MRTLALLLFLVGVASAQQAQKMLVPGHVGEYPSSYPVTDTLYCFTVPVEYSITNATKMASTISSGGSPFGFAIYPNADGGTALASISTTATGASNLVAQSGLTPFSLTAGTLYRLCTCGSAGTNYFGVQQAIGCCQDLNVTQLVQAFHPTYAGTAANPCTATVPPATTGAITADATSPGRNAPKIPVVLFEK